MATADETNTATLVEPVHFPVVPAAMATNGPRTTVAQAALEYIDGSKQKSHKTCLGYKNAVELFVGHCKKSYFDEIRRDDILDFVHVLKTCISPKTQRLLGPSTVFNYFLKVIIFLNDRGIAKYVQREDWIQTKDWLAHRRRQAQQEQEISGLLRRRARRHAKRL
jgi:hypothetical protein